ncbi:MAG: hypothetical protein WB919_00805 [Candidatus Sulfotelmatobacter sp.]
MSTLNLSLVPLRQASLCLDCETITTAHTNCHACGSQALLNVARALDHRRPVGLASSRRSAGVAMQVPIAPRRDTFNRSILNLDRTRRESAVSRTFDLNLSESIREAQKPISFYRFCFGKERKSDLKENAKAGN